MKQITTYEEFLNLLKSETEWWLLKHSPNCGISASARQHIKKREQQNTSAHLYRLNVLDSGELKHKIAKKLDIQHESPQLILFRDGVAVDHTSHRAITKQWIMSHLS